ncbi:MAG: DUF3021 domain-containing protein [Clostridia bacterium]|nr:DUF3021 domain-containing protein [Clostridia bacterium]
MNQYLKSFLHRGLIFGGFGPVIVGIVFAILDATLEDFCLGGGQVLLAIVSTYLLAFIQAGASVFNQIEHWPLPKALACHFLSIYLAYVLAYVINAWIPFEPMVLVIFTGVFVVTYFAVWLTVYCVVKGVEKRLNQRLK